MKKVVFPAIVAVVLSLTSYGFSTLPVFSSFQLNEALAYKTPPAENFSFNENFDVIDLFINPCNREEVEVAFTIHYTTHAVINKNKAQFKSHYNAYGSGLGLTTGKKYRFIEIRNDMSTSSIEGCIMKISSILRFKLVTAGSDDNFTLTSKGLITFNTCTGETDIKRDGEFNVECI